MSVSSHPEDKDVDNENGSHRKEHIVVEDSNTGKKYVRIWRIEASREFILLMFIIVSLLAVSLYNPYQLLQVAKENKGNTDKIIENQERNWNKTQTFMTAQDEIQKNNGIDLVKLLFLFELDQERDTGKLMVEHNISNSHFVDLNSTHYMTEKGTFPLPYNINFTNLFNHTGLTD